MQLCPKELRRVHCNKCSFFSGWKKSMYTISLAEEIVYRGVHLCLSLNWGRNSCWTALKRPLSGGVFIFVVQYVMGLNGIQFSFYFIIVHMRRSVSAINQTLRRELSWSWKCKALQGIFGKLWVRDEIEELLCGIFDIASQRKWFLKGEEFKDAKLRLFHLILNTH